jgi:hypothetical protein
MLVVGAGEGPLAKARKCGGDGSNTDVSENFATINALSGHEKSFSCSCVAIWMK